MLPSLLPGMLTMFTGVYSNVHGVTGFDVYRLPHAEYNLLQTQDGFSGSALLVRPLWILSALSGVNTRVYQATQEFPLQVGGSERVKVDKQLILIDSLGHELGGNFIVPFEALEPLGGGSYRLRVENSSFRLDKLGPAEILVTPEADPKRARRLRPSVGGRADLIIATDSDRGGAYLAWIRGSLPRQDLVLYVSTIARREANRVDLLGEHAVDPPPMLAAARIPSTLLGALARLSLTVEMAWQRRSTWRRRWRPSTMRNASPSGSNAPQVEEHGGVLPALSRQAPAQLGGLLAAGEPHLQPAVRRALLGVSGAANGESRRVSRPAGVRRRIRCSGQRFRGHRPQHERLREIVRAYVNEVLRSNGLLAWRDEYTIDLSRTKILLSKGGGSLLQSTSTLSRTGSCRAARRRP